MSRPVQLSGCIHDEIVLDEDNDLLTEMVGGCGWGMEVDM